MPGMLKRRQLILMAIVAVDSLRCLPSNAALGWLLVVYYAVAIVGFFIPSALITAELANTVPGKPGAYHWVKTAFGKRNAFLSVWLQWLTMLIWTPAILTYVVTNFSYLFSTSSLPTYILLPAILCLFWLSVYLVLYQYKWVIHITNYSGLLGVLLPMIGIMLLCLVWLWQGQTNYLVTHQDTQWFNLVSLRNAVPLIFSLMGMEMIAIHAKRLAQPAKFYPQVVLIASLVILASMIPASLAIAVVVPHQDIQLLTGVVESISQYLHAFALEKFLAVFVISLAAGSYGIFLTWLISIGSYLQDAALDKSLPNFLSGDTARQCLIKQLIFMGSLITVISAIFIHQSAETVFWLLNMATAQLCLIYYLYLFTSAFYLRYKSLGSHPDSLCKNNFIYYGFCCLAILTCLLALAFGFIPPEHLSRWQNIQYELELIGLIVMGIMLGTLLYCKSANSAASYSLPQEAFKIN